MNQKTRKIIESWILIEYLSTGQLPNKGNQKRMLKDEVIVTETGNKSYVYLGAYHLFKMNELVRSYLKDNSEIINEDYTLNYAASIQIDENGKYIQDSLFIPQMQFFVKFIVKGSATLNKLATEMKFETENLNKEVVQILEDGVSYDTLKQIEKHLIEYFEIAAIVKPHIYTLQNQVEEPSEVNSLFISDLEFMLANDTASSTLERYINGNDSYMDINENKELIDEILTLDHLPNGRWPSDNRHKLSLMQQVAVNLVLNEKREIYSVNGPPGTGKTTLLKDIFANLIIERAEKMAEFKKPADAFKSIGIVDIDGFNANRYHIDPSIRGYGIVVASSNNGAVENISKDLPKYDQIIHEQDTFSESDRPFSDLIKQVDLFSEYVQHIFESKNDQAIMDKFSKHWGLFSVPMGKRENMNNVFSALLSGKKLEDGTVLPSLYNRLKEESFELNDWNAAVEAFENTRQEIEREKESIKKHAAAKKRINQLSTEISSLTHLQADIQRIEREMQFKKEQKELLPKLGLLQRLIGKKNSEVEKINQDLLELNQERYNKETALQPLEGIKKQLASDQQNLSDLEEHFRNDSYEIFDEEMWQEENYDKRQLSIPWVTRRLNYLRGKYFIQALEIHKLFNVANSGKFWSAFNVISKRQQLDLNNQANQELLKESWDIFHLIIPVVSTTFAALGNMYSGLGVGSIDYLFIDEAGQAVPQAAAGGVWRAKHVVAVGDPSQIEPVVTLEDGILKTVRDSYQLPSSYIGKAASVQGLADLANSYGMLNSTGERIGIPLWVHRRSLNPLFQVSNKISYDNKMVQGAAESVKDNGILDWIDVKGIATEKQYVKEHARVLLDRLKNQEELKDIYVISPFKAVVAEIKKYLLRHQEDFVNINKSELEKWCSSSIGTVHTFQGKEADVVYFICGTDKTTDAAADWSCQAPNLLNVAVTRAKKEFHIIGDYERYKEKNYYKDFVEFLNR